MVEYIYSIRTLTNKINVLLLNYLYSNPKVSVTIDTYSYNIFMQMRSEEDYNIVLENVKKYYTEYSVHVPPVPLTPIFVNEPIPDPQPSNTTTDTTSNTTTDTTNTTNTTDTTNTIDTTDTTNTTDTTSNTTTDTTSNTTTDTTSNTTTDTTNTTDTTSNTTTDTTNTTDTTSNTTTDTTSNT